MPPPAFNKVVCQVVSSTEGDNQSASESLLEVPNQQHRSFPNVKAKQSFSSDLYHFLKLARPYILNYILVSLLYRCRTLPQGAMNL